MLSDATLCEFLSLDRMTLPLLSQRYGATNSRRHHCEGLQEPVHTMSTQWKDVEHGKTYCTKLAKRHSPNLEGPDLFKSHIMSSPFLALVRILLLKAYTQSINFSKFLRIV